MFCGGMTGKDGSAGPPVSVRRGYPYFVLTRTDSTDELKAAIDFHNENPPDHRSTAERQAGQPFSVTGGYRYAGSIYESTQWARINQVWLEGTDAPYWWAVANAVNDRAEGYWVTYNDQNEPNSNIWMAWHDAEVPVAADFEDIGTFVPFEDVTFPAAAADAYFSVWLSEGVIFNIRQAGGVAYDFTLYFLFNAARRGGNLTRLPLEINGVAGTYVSTTAPISATTYGGVTRAFHLLKSPPLTYHDQPHPDVVRDVIRINGIPHDVARGQLVGPRPDNQADRTGGASPWGNLFLGYSPPAATGATTELITMQQQPRGLRLAPPAMYFGWVDNAKEIDFIRLARSQNLQGVIPRHSSDRAYFVLWISDEELRGYDCAVFDIGLVDTRHYCTLTSREGPDQRPGEIFIGHAPVPVAGRAGQILTVTPANHEEG